MQDIHRQFQDANQVTNPESLFEFLDAAAGLESVQAYQQRMLELCPPRPGQRILDLGCGLGHSALRLASLVAPTGSVVGIDKNAFLIEEARRRAAGSCLRPTYQVGDIKQLDFPPDSFDVCRVERVLMYLDNPQLVLDAMLRVVGPRGSLVFFEFDYDTVIVDALDSALTRWLGRLMADSVPSPWVGRQLPRLLRERGVRGVQIIPHVVTTTYSIFHRVVSGTIERAAQAGQLSADEVETWWRALEDASAARQFFAAFPGFIVCGHAA